MRFAAETARGVGERDGPGVGERDGNLWFYKAYQPTIFGRILFAPRADQARIEERGCRGFMDTMTHPRRHRMAKHQRERALPHRINAYASQWRRWQLRAAQEGVTVSQLIRQVMDAYCDGAQRRKK